MRNPQRDWQPSALPTQLQIDGEPERLVTQRLRASQQIYCDNGAAFVGSAMDLWAYANGVILDFSRRGKPTDDAMIERAPARECLNGCCCPSLDDGQQRSMRFEGLP